MGPSFCLHGFSHIAPNLEALQCHDWKHGGIRWSTLDKYVSIDHGFTIPSHRGLKSQVLEIHATTSHRAVAEFDKNIETLVAAQILNQSTMNIVGGVY